MNKFLPIPTIDFQKPIETPIEKQTNRPVKDIFVMEEVKEKVIPTIKEEVIVEKQEIEKQEIEEPIKKESVKLKKEKQTSIKQLEHLEKIRAKSLATRQKNADKKRDAIFKEEQIKRGLVQSPVIEEVIRKPEPPTITIKDIESAVEKALLTHTQKRAVELQDRQKQIERDRENLLQKLLHPKKRV